MKPQHIEEFEKFIPDVVEFAKYVKIQEPGRYSLDYELWPHLEDFFRILNKEHLVLVLKAKQIGVSWALALFALWHIYTTLGANVLMLSRGQEEARSLLSKCKVIYHNLPDWMKKFTIEPDSLESFGFKEWGSKIRALPSTEVASIGETSSLVIHDEWDFHPYAEVNFGHTKPTIDAGGKLVGVSTVDKSDPDSFFKNLYKAARDGRNGFKAVFFGWDVRPNRDQAWYERIKIENEAAPWLMEQNYPNSEDEALSPMATQSCFDKDRLQSLWENAIESPGCEQGFIYTLHPPRVGVSYAAAADVGEGVGLDYSCLSIAGKYGLESEVVAVVYSNTIGTDSFAFECDRLCRKYFNPLLCIDNIGIGKAVVDKLVELGYPNLYKNDKGKLGWSLTRPNKRELAVTLIENINNSGLITRFKPQVKELMEYQWVKAYPEPTGKTHGDTVISLMLANEMLKHTGQRLEVSAYVDGVRVL